MNLKNAVYFRPSVFCQVALARGSEGTFRSSRQAATCPLVFHIRLRLRTAFDAEGQAGKL